MAKRTGVPSPEQMIEIDLLLQTLDRRDPEIARVVNYHYVLGLTLEEAADLMGLSFRQVRHRWEKGRDWLKDRIQA
jgi:DNA-directed RNA polymerase specialized sigma24 family protein